MSVGIVTVGIAAVAIGAAWSWSSSMPMRRKPTVIAKACRECADPAEPNEFRCAHHRAVARSCRECADPAEPGELWCAHHRAIARQRAELRYEHFGCDRTGTNDCRECARWARHERVWEEAGHTCTLFSPSEDCPECARRKIAAWRAAGHTDGCAPHPPTLDDLAGDCPNATSSTQPPTTWSRPTKPLRLCAGTPTAPNAATVPSPSRTPSGRA